MTVIVLCADDYAMTAGVSAGILELARDRRLSATGVMTTLGRWSRDAADLAPLRDRVAIGLHFDLTLGTPLGPMPALAPQGRPPDVGTLTRMALTGRLSRAEIADELRRQIAAFRAALGHPPDYLDGHQHVHALPIVRDAVLEVLGERDWREPPLVRIPSDRPAAILGRRRAALKALILAGLARGFRSAVARAGLPANDTFAGVTGFARDGVAADFRSGMEHAGPLHILMCHPGHVDADLIALDPVTDRREAELAHIAADTGMAARIWRPDRAADGPPVDWKEVRRASC